MLTNNSHTLRCLSWSAVSSEEQASSDHESLDEQRRLNRAFIENDLPRLYPGYTGTLTADLEVVGSRSIVLYESAVASYPAYSDLDRLIQQRAFDVLVCRKRDRLGRRESLIVAIESLCEDAGIIVAARDSLPPTLDRERLAENEGHRIVGLIHSHQAAGEIRELKRRNQEGMIARVTKRKLFPFRVPYGYRYEVQPDGSKRIVVVEEQAQVIRRALVDMYLGRSLGAPAIVEELNRLGMPAPSGNRWGVNSLYKLIERVWRYAGYIELNQRGNRPYQKVQGDYPPILSEIEVAAIVAQAQERSFRRPPRTRLFSGVAICDVCRRPMKGSSQTYHRVDGTISTYYHMRCYRSDCPATITHISDKKLYVAIWTAVEYIESVADLAQLVEDDQPATAAIEERIAATSLRLDRLADSRERIKQAYYAGVTTTEDFSTDMRRVDGQLTATTEELAAAQAELQQAQVQGNRLARLEKVRRDGRRTLETAYDYLRETQQWLRKHFRIYVRDNTVVKVVIL